MTIIERAQRLLDTRPGAVAGQGGHVTTFSVACVLVHGFGLEPEEAMPLMQGWNNRCDPPWKDRDLMHKLVSARNAVHKEERGYLLKGGEDKGKVDAWKPQEKLVKKEYEVETLRALQHPELPPTWNDWLLWLRARSPIDPKGVDAGAFLDALYEPGDFVMCFENMRTNGDWMRWVGKGWFQLGKVPGKKAMPGKLPEGTREGMCFLMQPVDGQWRPVVGTAKMSRRTKASVTRWPFVLLESDKAPHPLWLNALAQAKIRVVAIVTSGGRSLHAVVRLDKGTEEELQAELQNPNAREVLTVLGCDAQAMQSLVYPRLPGVWREGKLMSERGSDGKAKRDAHGKCVMKFEPFEHGRRNQRLIYFNPRPEKGRSMMEGAIFEHEQ